MEYKNFTVVVIAALVASLIFAGTILAPIQSYAAESRSQHMNQGNLCYRSNTCRQSEVGQNTLGNDNQVTGFADQSDNIQQAAAPTPVNHTTGNNTTPIPTPKTCEECFKKFLTPGQINGFFNTDIRSLDELCLLLRNEPVPLDVFKDRLTSLGVTAQVQAELINCLESVGIPFPTPR
jgi:hypothetical protein